MSKQSSQKRLLICTFLALASGFFGGYVGGQMSVQGHSQNCQNQRWELFKTGCKFVVAPGAMWQGSTTGIWTGSVLGGFFAGLVTRKE
ncbi:hypothetical protein IQ247_30495 [Plectonema cf. radiosum LEGE 06105]|uniref:Uncharacterized protein n=1 Tax=Plectonema cf. radiosum LEGE 06105 TaxID=945769 RepID=A0A8J7K4D4_9CYAN|nr:hypothetical protein [Plectonema radiosum]MBE9216931.1 hypothetical protein [Plectonema cf. radiosum LEGE 06105]